MISPRMVRLIETHADSLSRGVALRLKTHPRTPSYRRIPESDIQQRSKLVYEHLGEWTMGTEEDIRRAFEALGRDRHGDGIPLHEVLYALLVHKNHLLNFIESQGQSTALEIYGEQQLRVAVDRFYDLAMYFTARGYSEATSAIPHAA